jgi:altronate hydrolase
MIRSDELLNSSEHLWQGHTLACDKIMTGQRLTTSQGGTVHYLLDADALYSRQGSLVSKSEVRRLCTLLQSLSAPALVMTATSIDAPLKLPSFLEELRPYTWIRLTNEKETSNPGSYDAASIKGTIDASLFERLETIKNLGAYRHIGVELDFDKKELPAQAITDLLATVDFISIRSDQLIANSDVGFRILSGAARCKVPVVCTPIDHEIFTLSSLQLEQYITRWLRGPSTLRWAGKHLSPSSTHDRSMVHHLQQLHLIAEEFGENLFTVSVKLASLWQDTAFAGAVTSVDQLHRIANQNSAVLPTAFWQALREHRILTIPHPLAMDESHVSHSSAIPDTVRIHPDDNAVFAARPLIKGHLLTVGTTTFITREQIPVGHLVLQKQLQQGEAVICYGRSIGTAARDFESGERISAEKLIPLPVISDPLLGIIGRARESLTAGSPVSLNQLDRNLEITVSTDAWRAPPTSWQPYPLPIQSEFLGYRRAPGRAGIRQYISIISQVGCTEAMTDSYIPSIREQLRSRYPHMDLVAVSHGFGCSHTENATKILPRLVSNLSENDNIGAIVWMGLGCQQLQQDELIQLGDPNISRYRKPERWIVAQNLPSEYRTLRNTVLELAEQISEQKRELIPVSELMSFVECGGSDGLSGVTANPLVGRVSRMLAAHGATVMIGETTELPAEHFLEWSATEEVARACLGAKIRYNRYLSQFGGDERYNPVKGNKDGGISTALHKALGSAQKIAGIPIRECVSYGNKSSHNLAGVSFVDATSNDPRSVTARVIAGATLGFFTSGRMTPWGSSIAPTIKVATNTDRAKLKADWVDFDAGRMISEGASLDDLAAELYALTLRVANGAITQSERLGTTGVELWLPDTGFQ